MGPDLAAELGAWPRDGSGSRSPRHPGVRLAGPAAELRATRRRSSARACRWRIR